MEFRMTTWGNLEQTKLFNEKSEKDIAYAQGSKPFCYHEKISSAV